MFLLNIAINNNYTLIDCPMLAIYKSFINRKVFLDYKFIKIKMTTLYCILKFNIF